MAMTTAAPRSPAHHLIQRPGRIQRQLGALLADQRLDQQLHAAHDLLLTKPHGVAHQLSRGLAELRSDVFSAFQCYIVT